MKSTLAATLFLFISNFAFAIASDENRLNTGQGIAVPGLDTLVNLGRGYTLQNPAGVMYQDGFRLTGQYAKNGVSDTGFEGGYSGKTVGLAAGIWQPGCDDCESITGVLAGAALSKNILLGLRYMMDNEVPTYGVGLLFNSSGEHRVGLNTEMVDPEGPQNNISNHAVGYGYVTKGHTIAVDYSIQKFENSASTPDPEIKILSLSFQKRVNKLSASLSYEQRMDDPAENNDEFWMGVGFNQKNWQLSVYAEYRQEVMAVLSGYF